VKFVNKGEEGKKRRAAAENGYIWHSIAGKGGEYRWALQGKLVPSTISTEELNVKKTSGGTVTSSYGKLERR